MRTISDAQGAVLLEDVFGLSVPVSFDDVKIKYRAESRLHHPDVGGNAEHFKKLSDSFDKLKRLYQFGSSIFDALQSESTDARATVFPRQTVDGTPLSELGLGLGPTTNGRDCSECKHNGYTTVTEHGWETCTHCHGGCTAPREIRCRACHGSGKFTQRRSGRVVDCRVCQGKGRFQHPYLKQPCIFCGGRGNTRNSKAVRILALKCGVCRGSGEIEIWNPVLPKGRLVSGLR